MFFNKKLTHNTVIPRHIAFIMDGNGRWARRRGMPRELGHAVGAETFRRVIDICEEIGVEYMTTYAFSTENWNRPPSEVDAIMKLMDKYLDEMLVKLSGRNAIVRFIGDRSRVPEGLQVKMAELEAQPKAGKRMTLNIAFNYGSRAEIVRAFNELHRTCSGEITEQDISGALYTRGQPDPDLVVRTGGDIRVSNYLLWQSSYSEFYFTKTLWPDFNRGELYKAIIEYSGRQRRFGKTSAQVEQSIKK